MIFRSGPFLAGERGMYLNKWTPEFNSENDFPSTCFGVGTTITSPPSLLE
jgi:hypothetical protein